MSSRLLTLIAPVVFVTVPLVCFAQRFGPSRSFDKTLLTGPLLLSPASPPQSPMPNQQWIFIRAANELEAARTAATTAPAAAGPSTLLPDNAYSLTPPARPEVAPSPFASRPAPGTALQLGQRATLRLIPDAAAPHQKLRATAPQERPRTRKPVPDRFDAQVPPLPTHLLPGAKANPAAVP